MHHLAVCPQLYEDFWSHILDYADDLNLQTPKEGESVAMYLILGCIRKEGEWAVVNPATAGVLAISWRCLLWASHSSGVKFPEVLVEAIGSAATLNFVREIGRVSRPGDRESDYCAGMPAERPFDSKNDTLRYR